MMNIVLTGATGYVGQAFIKVLGQLPLGDISVKALVRSSKCFDAPSFVEPIEGDLTNIPVNLFFDEPHVLIHFAVKQFNDDGEGFNKTNVIGTQNLLSQCNKHTLGVIYASTLSVQGQKAQRNIAESAALQPKTALAKSRALAENLIIDSMKKSDKWALCLRPRFILGEEDRYVLPGFIKLARNGIYIGDGQQKYSVITVSDYATIILKLARLINTQGLDMPLNRLTIQQIPINVGYQSALSFHQFFTEIRQHIPAKKRVISVPAPQWITRVLKWIPSKAIRSKTTQLELVGFDHYGDVSRLEQLIGNDITQQNSLDKLRALLG